MEDEVCEFQHFLNERSCDHVEAVESTATTWRLVHRGEARVNEKVRHVRDADSALWRSHLINTSLQRGGVCVPLPLTASAVFLLLRRLGVIEYSVRIAVAVLGDEFVYPPWLLFGCRWNRHAALCQSRWRASTSDTEARLSHTRTGYSDRSQLDRETGVPLQRETPAMPSSYFQSSANPNREAVERNRTFKIAHRNLRNGSLVVSWPFSLANEQQPAAPSEPPLTQQ